MADSEESAAGGVASRVPPHTYYTALWLIVAAVVMLFAGLTSAFVVRKGLAGEWRAIALPRDLYWCALLLIANGVWTERIRRKLRERSPSPSSQFIFIPVMMLGAGSLACIVLSWHALSNGGILFGTTASSSFLYLLTGAYAVLLAGGLGALAWLVSRLTIMTRDPRGAVIANAIIIYWHFLTILWLYLLALLAANM